MSIENLSRVWPEWTVEKRLGKGSYGEVYQVIKRDQVGARAAVKVISIPSDESEIDSLRSEGHTMEGTRTYLKSIVDDFIGEIKTMNDLKALPNIVSVEDYKVYEKENEIGWDIFIRMELLTPFSDYINGRRIEEAEAIRIGVDICTALEICAVKGIIHRDIKPANLFVNSVGQFKLGDFGIARKLDTLSGSLSGKGTPEYIAPEVKNGAHHYDARVDTYSLGLVLYRLLNGNYPPFIGEKEYYNALLRNQAEERRTNGDPLPPPSDASPAMASLILRACAFDPDDRFSSATEMKQALQSVSAGTYVPAPLPVKRKEKPYDPGKTTTARGGSAPGPAVTKPDARGKASRTPGSPVPDPEGTKPAKVSPEKDAGTKKKSKLPAAVILILVAALAVGGVLLVPALMKKLPVLERVEESEDVRAETDAAEPVVTAVPDGADAEDAGPEPEEDLPETEAPAEPEPEPEPEPGTEEPADPDAEARSEAISTAGADALSGNYLAAILTLNSLMERIGEDDELLTLRESYYGGYEASVVRDADALAAKEDYEGAVASLENGLGNYSGSVWMQDKLGEYNARLSAKRTEAVKQEAVSKSAEEAGSGNYPAAIGVLEQARSQVGDDPEILVIINNYRETYLNITLTAVETRVSEGEYGEAEKLIDEAEEILTDNAALESKRETIRSLAREEEAAKTEAPVTVPVQPQDNGIETLIAAKIPQTNRETPITGTVAEGSEVKVRGGRSLKGAVSIAREDMNVSLFDAKDAVDWYTVTASSNYSGYCFTVYNDSVDTEIYLKVYDAHEKELGTARADRGRSGSVDLNPGKDAVLYIAVSRYFGDRNGNYRFSVNERLCDAGMDHDSAFEILIDKPYEKALDLREINDWYVFTATEDYAGYNFTLNNNSVDTEVYLKVYDEYDKELGTAKAERGRTGALDLMLSKGRVYYISVSRYFGDRLGKYGFSVNEMQCDAGASPEDAFRILTGKEYEKALDLREINDWFTFTASENYSGYRFTLANASVDTEAYLKVYDEYDKELGTARADRGKTGVCDLVLSPGRPYRISVTRYFGDRLGNYRFSVEERICDAGVKKDEAFEAPVGTVCDRGLDLIDYNDWFVFTPSKQSCHVELTNKSIDTTAYLTVYDRNDKEIGAAKADRGKNNTVDLTVEPGEEYYICVSRYFGDRNGTYSFRISE